MGPSVKFVTCINGSFLKKKIRGHYFYSEKDQTVGGQGRFGKRPDLLPVFFGNLP